MCWQSATIRRTADPLSAWNGGDNLLLLRNKEVQAPESTSAGAGGVIIGH